MRYLILLLLLSTQALAKDYKLIELDSLFIDYKKFDSSNRDPYFYNSTKYEELSINVTTDIAGFIYWDSMVHGDTNHSKYEEVGLETRLGIRLTQSIEVGYYHHSRHLLDDTFPYQGFAVDDAFQIKIYLYNNTKRKALIQ